MTYLLDTNVVSEIRKATADARVVAWIYDTDSSDLYLSALMLGEIAGGIERLRLRRDPRQAELFELWLGVLETDFADRVLPISAAIARRWGQLNASQPLPVVDGLLAATAIEHDLTLVTRDTGRLGATGVRLLDPWAGRPPTGRTG